MRDEIGLIRDSGMFPSEWMDRPERGEAPLPNSKDIEFAYQKRWDRLVEVAGDLDARLLEAEVLWGSSLSVPQDNLKKLVARLNVNLRRHLRTLTNARYAEGLSKERFDQIEAVVWKGEGDERDEFGEDLQAIVSQFESSLRQHLGRRVRRKTGKRSLRCCRGRSEASR